MTNRVSVSRPLSLVLLTVLLIGVSLLWWGSVPPGEAAGDAAVAEGRRLIEAVVRHVRTVYIARNVDEAKLYERGGKGVLETAGKACSQAADGSLPESAPLLYALIDRVQERCAGAPNAETLYLRAARGILEALGDPYTRLMEPSAFKEFIQETRGFFYGIGIYIDVKDDHLIVVQPIANTPASRAGLHAGDRILRIDGFATKGMALQEAVSRIRGIEGTTVRLTIGRGDREVEVSIVRSRINLVVVQGANELDEASRSAMRQAGIGYINLVTFNHDRAAALFDQELAQVRRARAKALIVDLRNNGGGLLDESLEIADRFLPRGAPILHMFDRSGRQETSKARSGDRLTIPVVVLVNEFSASASEIVSAALQDNKAATIVGVRTFGKNLVQSIVDLPMGAGAAITTSKWLTPSGRDIGKKGLTPDVVVGETEEALRERLKGRPDAEIEQRVQRMKIEQLQRAIDIVKRRISRTPQVKAAA